MKIRLLAPVANSYGVFQPGDEVDWPEKNAQPLIDCGAAEVAVGKPRKKAED